MSFLVCAGSLYIFLVNSFLHIFFLNVSTFDQMLYYALINQIKEV